MSKKSLKPMVHDLSQPMKKALIDALDGGVCYPRMNTRAALIDRNLLSPTGDGRSARLTDIGLNVARCVKQEDAHKQAGAKTIFDRTPIGHVLIDPHGDPWIRVPGGVVEVIMRPSSGGLPIRILHPPEDFAECEEFGPFTQVEDA